MNISKDLKSMNSLCKLELTSGVLEIISKLPETVESIAEKVYNKNYELTDDNTYEKDLKNLLEILQYIFNNTSETELVSNETYDKLYEAYKELTGSDIVGSNVVPNSKKTRQHRFPHLRGSLDKVHYLRKKDIPSGDSRKSLQDWFDKCTDGVMDDVLILSRFKFDGVSLIFEYDRDKNLQCVLTRGDTEQNIAQDVTDTFRFYTFHELFGHILDHVEFTDDFAIKTECIMTMDSFNRYNEENGLNLKNTRSAIISFINSEDHKKEDLSYIDLEVLEVSSKGNVIKDVNDTKCTLVELGNQNEFNTWVVFDNVHSEEKFGLKPNAFETNVSEVSMLESYINHIIKRYNEGDTPVPIDGIVFTICDQDIVFKMGRKDNINKFQIAYKFPAGVKKTKVKDVKFQVGLMGGITPVVELEPITIMGNTLLNASTGSINKLNELDINIGDEVIIKYDIIPVIMKDDTCVKGNGPKIIAPDKCPICGEDLHNEGLNVFCGNDDCGSRIIGKLVNYTNKLDIKHISIETITTLVENGFLHTIGDLYRLKDKTGAIVQLRGFKENMMNKINGSIYSKLELYPHELLGSLGIPSVGRKMMEKACRVIPFDELIQVDDSIINKLSEINGLGNITANKMVDGIRKNIDLIEDLLRYITIKPYKENEFSETVVFTGVRDKKFEEYLYNLGVRVASSYSKNIDIVITKDPNGTSVKLNKAREDGKVILSLEQAKEKYSYV